MKLISFTWGAPNGWVNSYTCEKIEYDRTSPKRTYLRSSCWGSCSRRVAVAEVAAPASCWRVEAAVGVLLLFGAYSRVFLVWQLCPHASLSTPADLSSQSGWRLCKVFIFNFFHHDGETDWPLHCRNFKSLCLGSILWMLQACLCF